MYFHVKKDRVTLMSFTGFKWGPSCLSLSILVLDRVNMISTLLYSCLNVL